MEEQTQNISAEGKKVLVIEDDPGIMTSITHVLRHNRFECVGEFGSNKWL